ncbi:g6247 [Coccomyxa viridis]|uniref:Glutathione synthetase n=1 Tax=Coccomyxa viridis TaxID=1274662 RepID=A0ABP1FX92_9CHLO
MQLVGLGDDGRPRAAVHAPISVLPVPFPRDSFEKAKKAMQIFNTLIDRVSRDGAYLRSTLRAAAEFDEFTARLLQVFDATEDCRQQRFGEQVVLAINRSDYMLDEPSSTLLQVELNTIASSFGCLSTQVCKMHRYIVERAGQPNLDVSNLPANDVTSQIADAIGSAVHAYGCDGAAVLFIVQPDEKNSYDQQWLQYAIWEQHKVRTVRRTLAQIAEQGSLDSSGNLSIDGQRIAVCYYRAGYAPTDYPSEAEWDAREMMERSTAAQCPSVGYQLAGAKKVQQDLAGSHIVEKFVDSADEATLIRACFAGLWSLDNKRDPGTQEVLNQASTRPEDFVLKPQREGGGNNLYGEALQQRIADPKGLAAYILMQRIRPPINRSMLLRNGEILEVDTLSELGIYGTFVRQGDRVILNEEAGHLIRTKAATSDEGGVAAGFAVLDSPYLTE